ncbi:hypothetical protein ACFQV2_31680 [Actinokineospora soli]|uniref:Uncharacterized protein n=1 Tax=Actinokineospora soli TaxID=1048753 RepID=A0ABW2TWV7_9PSEU
MTRTCLAVVGVAVVGVAVVVDAVGVGVGEVETAVVDGRVQGDDVLQVEQVGVLCRGHHRARVVGQLARRPVTVREYGEDAADAEPPCRVEGDEVGGVAVTEVVAAVRREAGDDQVGAVRGLCRRAGEGRLDGDFRCRGDRGRRGRRADEVGPERAGGRCGGRRVDRDALDARGAVEAFDGGDGVGQLGVRFSVGSMRDDAVGADRAEGREGRSGVGQSSSTTRSAGLLNEVTIRSTRAAGHVASRSIGAGPAVQTVAGVGVEADPRERERPVLAVGFAGLAGLTRVLVGAVGQGRRSPPRRPPGRAGAGWVESGRAVLRRRGERRAELSGWATGVPSPGWARLSVRGADDTPELRNTTPLGTRPSHFLSTVFHGCEHPGKVHARVRAPGGGGSSRRELGTFSEPAGNREHSDRSAAHDGPLTAMTTLIPT